MDQLITQSIPLGDQEAVRWETEYHKNLSKVYNYFLYQMGDAHLAKDLAAETFEEAWKSRKRYKPNKGAYTTWLFAIARQKRAKYYRKCRFTQVQLTNTIEDFAPSPVDEAEKSFEKQKLYGLIAELPPKEQEIIALRYGSGMTNREIARVTGIPESTVSTILLRVIKLLRHQWDAS